MSTNFFHLFVAYRNQIKSPANMLWALNLSFFIWNRTNSDCKQKKKREKQQKNMKKITCKKLTMMKTNTICFLLKQMEISCKHNLNSFFSTLILLLVVYIHTNSNGIIFLYVVYLASCNFFFIIFDFLHKYHDEKVTTIKTLSNEFLRIFSYLF